jgi:hypothetical protein
MTENPGTRTPTSLLSALWDRLVSPVDIAALVYFRIAFGTLMLWEMAHDFSPAAIERFYVSPKLHFTYYGFDWVTPWPGQGMYWHVYVLAGLAVLIGIGLWYRLSVTLFFFGFTYLFLLDQTRYINHFYLICLLSFLLMFMPAHRAFSVDSWRRPALRHDTTPALWLWLLRFQFGVVYFYGGVAKINGDWLRGKPLDGWLTGRTDFPVIGHLFTEKSMAYFFSYSGLLIDLFVVPLLLWKRTRLFALVVAVMFNLTNARLWTIGVFPWLMIAGTLLFLPPDWPRKLFAALRPVTGPPPDSAQAGSASVRAPSKVTVSFFALYAVLHIVIPLRHFLYPGHVHWTEEGHRFAWHMMLRGKNIDLRLFVIDHEKETPSEIRLRSFLTPQQLSVMPTRPDMILQFVHYMARDLRRQGHGRFEIRAHATGSLNGREPQVFIDPAIDLSSQPRTLRHAAWIVPLVDPTCRTCDRDRTASDRER